MPSSSPTRAPDATSWSRSGECRRRAGLPARERVDVSSIVGTLSMRCLVHRIGMKKERPDMPYALSSPHGRAAVCSGRDDGGELLARHATSHAVVACSIAESRSARRMRYDAAHAPFRRRSRLHTGHRPNAPHARPPRQASSSRCHLRRLAFSLPLRHLSRVPADAVAVLICNTIPTMPPCCQRW